MRTVGSLRVILNTKLYRGMPVELPADKNLRLTGLDDSGKPRVFLVTGYKIFISYPSHKQQQKFNILTKVGQRYQQHACGPHLPVGCHGKGKPKRRWESVRFRVRGR